MSAPVVVTEKKPLLDNKVIYTVAIVLSVVIILLVLYIIYKLLVGEPEPMVSSCCQNCKAASRRRKPAKSAAKQRDVKTTGESTSEVEVAKKASDNDGPDVPKEDQEVEYQEANVSDAESDSDVETSD